MRILDLSKPEAKIRKEIRYQRICRTFQFKRNIERLEKERELPFIVQ